MNIRAAILIRDNQPRWRLVSQARLLAIYSLMFLAFGISGCSFGGNQTSEEQRQRDEKTREEAATATERAKPEIEAAGRALGRAAEAAAEDAHAAAEGIKDGWKQRNHESLDLNSAGEKELSGLPGVSPTQARRIVGTVHITVHATSSQREFFRKPGIKTFKMISS